MRRAITWMPWVAFYVAMLTGTNVVAFTLVRDDAAALAAFFGVELLLMAFAAIGITRILRLLKRTG